MNPELRNNAKKVFEKNFFKLMKSLVFGKTVENVRKQKYQDCNNRKRRELFGVRTKLSHNKMVFKKIVSYRHKVFMNKSVYLGPPILDIGMIT